MYTPQERDYLTLYRKIIVSLAHINGINRTQLEFLIFLYNKDYITWREAFKDFYASNKFLHIRIPQLEKKGLLTSYKPYSKRKGESRTYCLTQKSRLLVARIYRMIEGGEDIPDIYGRGEI